MVHGPAVVTMEARLQIGQPALAPSSRKTKYAINTLQSTIFAAIYNTSHEVNLITTAFI